MAGLFAALPRDILCELCIRISDLHSILSLSRTCSTIRNLVHNIDGFEDMLYRKQRIMRSAYSTAYKGTALLFDLRKEDKIVYAPIYVLLDTASEEDTRKLINPIILSKPKHFFADSPGKEFFIHLMSHNIVSPLKLAYKALRFPRCAFIAERISSSSFS